MGLAETIAGQLRNTEFKSAIIRLALWMVGAIHVSVTGFLGKLPGEVSYYIWTFGIVLPIIIGILVSIIFRPVWPVRPLASLAIDIGAVTAIVIQFDAAINPYCLFYIWIIVSYGARYGKAYLPASAGSVAAYTGAALVQGYYVNQAADPAFFLGFLIVLPFYQYMLVNSRLNAERATEVKNRFLATMTHELRTPLSGLIGMARLMESTRLDREQRDYLNAIRASSGVLMSLIGDILDFSKLEARSSKLEARRLKIDISPFDIRTCVGSVCQSLSNRAEEKGLELICEIDKSVPNNIESDEVRLKQILYNLIGNAIKFTSHVLLAEDDPINARFVNALLTKSGHRTTLTDNGLKALQLLCSERFDLALLDIRMPEMSGIDVARQLRSVEASGLHLPIVALTASALSEVREECLSAGMDGFLMKPVDPQLLSGLIERFAGRRVPLLSAQ